MKLDEPNTPKEKLLQIYFLCINDAPGPGGISPTIIVFGVSPKLPEPQSLNMSLAARTRTIREWTQLSKRLKAQRILQESSRRRHVASTSDIREIEKLIPGDDVLIYREKEGWRSYPFVRLNRVGVVVQLPTKHSKFAITSCRVAKHAPITSEGELIPLPKIAKHQLDSEQPAVTENSDVDLSKIPESNDIHQPISESDGLQQMWIAQSMHLVSF